MTFTKKSSDLRILVFHKNDEESFLLEIALVLQFHTPHQLTVRERLIPLRRSETLSAIYLHF